MKELLVILGVGALGYGLYLESRKRKPALASAAKSKVQLKLPPVPGKGITIQPTQQSTAIGVDNSASQVQGYNTALVWPITTILPGGVLPGAASLDHANMGNMQNFVQ
jgi:hypothetical protein